MIDELRQNSSQFFGREVKLGNLQMIAVILRNRLCKTGCLSFSVCKKNAKWIFFGWQAGGSGGAKAFYQNKKAPHLLRCFLIKGGADGT